jgi:hypothetical protein
MVIEIFAKNVNQFPHLYVYCILIISYYVTYMFIFNIDIYNNINIHICIICTCIDVHDNIYIYTDAEID